eukprot:3056854-Amphidinium_carterae.1
MTEALYDYCKYVAITIITSMRDTLHALHFVFLRVPCTLHLEVRSGGPAQGHVAADQPTTDANGRARMRL